MKTLTLYNPVSTLFRNGGFSPDPFELLDRMFENESFFDRVGRNPAIDVSETDAGYLIEVELPGLSEKNLKLEIKEGVLSLSTAVKEEKAEEGASPTWLRRERREFTFARSFLLPDNADGEKVQARLKDGLLSVEVPKKPESAPRLVPVKVA